MRTNFSRVQGSAILNLKVQALTTLACYALLIVLLIVLPSEGHIGVLGSRPLWANLIETTVQGLFEDVSDFNSPLRSLGGFPFCYCLLKDGTFAHLLYCSTLSHAAGAGPLLAMCPPWAALRFSEALSNLGLCCVSIGGIKILWQNGLSPAIRTHELHGAW